MSDTTFILPDSTIYNSSNPFPDQPAEIIRQGSAMGYSVVTLSGTPVRYIPADSTLEILTKVTLHIEQGPSEIERIFPNRETEWSAAMRERGILSLITNPEALVFYQHPATISYEDRTSYLSITQAPSPEGDGVDMVIITSEDLVDAFEQVADYRTQQGIVTVVRTVQWIDQFYSGCDTPERIRNFIRDAHEEWGIQAVILGGDDDIVPVRECRGWSYTTPILPSFQLPSDDYYADIDGNWSYNSGLWLTYEFDHYLDLCVGRWPVDNSYDVDLMLTKLKLYEWPENFPEDYARRLLLLGSNGGNLDGATHLSQLTEQLEISGAVTEYLDYPTELYYWLTEPHGDLNRNNALAAFDQGYNLIIHADHSGVHEIGTAAKGTPIGEVMWGSDFSTMGNTNEPSILWTLGCDPGWFDGADCFSEAGLLTSDNTGLVAVISNSRYGNSGQWVTFCAFSDALFNTGWIDFDPTPTSDWPLSYLGEAHRCSNNYDGDNMFRLNLLGSPLMYVWRDDPGELSISTPPVLLREGIPQDITVTVN